jgi:hypothetical protein
VLEKKSLRLKTMPQEMMLRDEILLVQTLHQDQEMTSEDLNQDEMLLEPKFEMIGLERLLFNNLEEKSPRFIIHSRWHFKKRK